MPRIRREQVCARCRNHDMIVILKGHKKVCQFLNCPCTKCLETNTRRKFIACEIAFHRKNSKNCKDIRRDSTDDAPKINDITKMSKKKYLCEVRKSQLCARCRNHGIKIPIRGHKSVCPFSLCECKKCMITVQRRQIMAKQIKDYRRNSIAEIIKSGQQTVEDIDSGYSGSPEDSPDVDVLTIKYPEAATKSQDELENSIIEKPESPEIEPPQQAPVPLPNPFFMVQSLYEKYCLDESLPKLQFLYAFVLLANQNWSYIDGALKYGSAYSEKFYKHHEEMAKEHIRLTQHLPQLCRIPPQLPELYELPAKQLLRVKSSLERNF